MPALCTQAFAAMPGLRCRARALRRRTRGFTLIELIMVIVILGVLAVFAAPRMFNSSDFYARGFQDETRALLRYAQKTAIAQRRAVCVTVAATGIDLKIATDNPATNCAGTLTLPNQPKAGSGLSASVSPFKFVPLGSTDQSADVTLTFADGTAIVIDKDTGYVK